MSTFNEGPDMQRQKRRESSAVASTVCEVEEASQLGGEMLNKVLELTAAQLSHVKNCRATATSKQHERATPLTRLLVGRELEYRDKVSESSTFGCGA